MITTNRKSTIQYNRRDVIMKVTKENKSFRSFTYTTLMKECEVVQETILYPFIKDGGAVMIYAGSGLGKSFYSMGIAVAIATGTEYLGYKAPRNRRVKYIDGEMSIYDLNKRVEGAIGSKGNDIKFIELLNNNLLLANRELSTDANTKFFDIGTQEDINKIVKELIDEGVEVVVFDNFSTLALGIEDENSASSFNITLELILRLKSVGILPIVIHHSNKTGSAYRGTTKIEAVFSIIIGLHYIKELNKKLGAGFTIKFDKNRNEYSELTDSRSVQLLKDSMEWVEIDNDNSKLVDLVDAIKSLNYINQTELGVALGAGQSTIHRWIKKAIAFDLITQKKYDDCVSSAKDVRGEVFDMEEDKNDF